MPMRLFLILLAAVLAAGGLTVALIAALPGHGMSILIPLALAAVLVLRLLPRKK
ncbi:hypothetical protein SAMN05444722_1111 [Rhodovulum sp. ES.010]|uniref:hypothetical protein n=1 Tax=Rhodovulum sp. ES.010 TaxID=1882821 RepID=UPI0009261797|nr:hypothetical protein [Rhodovulum sp. ES.010]SIO26909.1 hypothetical protein SAMN05444722_1111 [Rhodovulum sp. ES.010]